MLAENETKDYKKSFQECCSINTYEILAESLDRVIPSGRHKGEIFCGGSTITADNCHRQLKPFTVNRKKNESIYTTFPRPYKKCIPGQPGHQIICSTTFYSLFQEVQEITLQFVKSYYMPSTRRDKMLYFIDKCQSIVPSDLRIANTFFTHLTLHGKGELQDKSYTTSYYKHVDPHDIITVIIHLGNVETGGETVYYEGTEKCPGKPVKKIAHQNGNIQIGCYNKILHAQVPYKGRRGSMILNLKAPIVEYFQTYGTSCYEQYKLMGYPQKFTPY